MNRRSILGAIAGAPFIGKAVAETAVGGLGPLHGGPTMGEQFKGNNAIGAINPPNPLVSRQTALRAILSDKKAMEEIRDELFANHSQIHHIDPDIQIMRSFSTMAKITFQRQRNVERSMDSLFRESKTNIPQIYIQAFAGRLNKMMWGRE